MQSDYRQIRHCKTSNGGLSVAMAATMEEVMKKSKCTMRRTVEKICCFNDDNISSCLKSNPLATLLNTTSKIHEDVKRCFKTYFKTTTMTTRYVDAPAICYCCCSVISCLLYFPCFPLLRQLDYLCVCVCYPLTVTVFFWLPV